MIETIILQDVLMKTLPKTVDSLVLDISPRELNTNFSDGISLIGSVKAIEKMDGMPEASLPLGNTQALLNMLSIMGEGVELNVINDINGTPINLKIKNRDLDANYVLADQSIIRNAKIKKIPDSIKIPISMDTRGHILSANKAIATKHFAILSTTPSTVNLVTNYNKNANSDFVDVKLIEDEEITNKVKRDISLPIYFDYSVVLEVLNANKDLSNCEIGLSGKFLLLCFSDEGIETTYVVTPKTLI